MFVNSLSHVKLGAQFVQLYMLPLVLSELLQLHTPVGLVYLLSEGRNITFKALVALMSHIFNAAVLKMPRQPLLYVSS